MHCFAQDVGWLFGCFIVVDHVGCLLVVACLVVVAVREAEAVVLRGQNRTPKYQQQYHDMHARALELSSTYSTLLVSLKSTNSVSALGKKLLRHHPRFLFSFWVWVSRSPPHCCSVHQRAKAKHNVNDVDDDAAWSMRDRVSKCHCASLRVVGCDRHVRSDLGRLA